MIVIVLFTALFAPYFIDWASYKKDFERETSRVLGHKVEVRGETTLRLLPLPSVSFSDLTIGTNPDNSPMMSADLFSMDIELMPMLKGEVKIVKLNLVGPELNLYFSQEGEIAWTSGQKLAVDPDLVKLDNFTVTNGRVNIQGLPDGRQVQLEQLNGAISAKSLYGPWRIKGDGIWGDYRGEMDFVTGRLQDDGTIRLKASLNTPHLPFKTQFDGPLQLSGGPLGWQGIFTAEAVEEDKDNQTQTLTLGVPVFSEGQFTITQNLIDVPDYRLEIGARDDPYTITGQGLLNLDENASFIIQAKGRQIDLDRVGKLNSDEFEGGGVNLKSRFDILRTIADRIPKISLDGTINLELPAIVAGDTLIRDVRAEITPDKAGWNIKALQAVFPGNTVVEAQGKVGVGDAFGFNGNLTVASRQPTGLAAWLGKRDNPYVRKLNAAGFTADANISESQFSLDNLELKLDAATLRGKLQRLPAKNGRAKIIAQLEGEQIDLDDLRAIYALATGENAGANSYHDLDISLKAARLTGFDITAKDVETRFHVREKSVSIERLNAADFLGATLTSDNIIEDVLNQPTGSFSLVVKATDPTRLFEFIHLKAPSSKILDTLAASSDLFEDLDLTFSVDARPFDANGVSGSKGRAKIKGEMGGTWINIETDFNGDTSDPGAIELDVDLALRNDSPAKLALQLGLPVLPVEIEGPVNIGGNFKGAARDQFQGVLSADIGDTKFSVDGQVFLAGVRAGDASFKVTHSALDITPLLVLGGVGAASLIYDSQAVITSFNGDIDFADNKIILERGRGQINGHDFDADLEFTRNTTSNHRITGKIAAVNLDLPLLAQVALNSSDIGRLEGSSAGGSSWSQTNFGYPFLQGLDGEIALNVESSNLGIGAPAQTLRGQLALVDGSINLNDIKGEWLGGLFDANLSLNNIQGIGSINAQYNFYEIDGGKLIKSIDAKDFIDGQLNVSGQLEGSGRSPAAIMSSLSGSGTIDMKNVVIKGINTAPLAHVLVAADQENFEIQDNKVLPVLLEVIDEGSIKVPAVSIPYVVAVGKLRARNISVEVEGGTLKAAVEIDIKNQTQSAQLSLRLDPGKEWVEGSIPQIDMAWQGEVTDPQRSIDVQPLSGFLSLRNFEKEQRRVDLLQASILEKQRLRRDVLVTNARVRYRQRLRDEELRRQRQAFLKLEEDRLRELANERHFKLLAAERVEREEALRVASELERKKLLEKARIAAEVERKRLAKQARIAAELEHKRLEEEARKAKAERKRLEAELQKAEEKRQRLAEEARKAEAEREHLAEKARKAEAEQLRLADEAQKAEAERLGLAQEAERAKADQQLREQQDEAAALEQRKAEEAKRLQLAEQERLKLAEEKRREEERKRIEEQLNAPTSADDNTAPVSPDQLYQLDGNFAKNLENFLKSQ